MTWWRKNWVDALMIGLILSVVGGFVALLLRGSPTTLAEDPNTMPVVAPPPTTSSTPAPPVTATTPDTTPPTASEPAPPPVTTAPSEPDASQSASTATTPPAASSASDSSAASSSTSDSTTSSASDASTSDASAMASKPTNPPAASNTTADSSKPSGSMAPDSAQKPSSSATGTTQDNSGSKPATTASSKPNANDVPQLDSNSGNAAVMASSKPAPKASTITEIPRFQTTQPRVETAPKPRPTVEARPTPRSQPKATTSTPARSVYLRSYRVAVGSFTSASGAASVAAKLRAQGFKARALPSGRVSVVVLGPYSNESTAKTALDGVQGQYPDAILYRPNGTKLRAQATPKPTPAPSEASNTVSGETPPITAAEDVQAAQADIAPATPAYLQVGAFKNVSSAQPLMRKLEGLGYPTTLRTSADGYTRVLVGPLEGDAFKRARSKLRTRGFQPFAVSQ